MRIKVLICLTLFLSIFPNISTAAANSAVPVRSLVDRPDDLTGYQVRLIYVVPADVKDRNLDTNGTISKWIEEVRKVSRIQTGLTPRFDMYQNKFDVGYLKSKYTIAQLVGTANSTSADDLLRKELSTSEQNSLKGIGFVIDGRVSFSDYCGYASRPGKYFTTWLSEGCWEDSDLYNNRPYITWIARSILHEWLHNLGVEHTCVKDDLMWGSGCEATEQGDNNSIDAKRENYLRANKSGVDISQLPVWEETINTGLINLEFQKINKSSNPWRNSTGLNKVWGSFYLSDSWVQEDTTIWNCEVKASTGLQIPFVMKNGNCEARIPANMKIGTRLYMTVSVTGLWQKSGETQIFDVLGENGEEKYCETKTCIVGETLKLDINLCFNFEGYAKLQLKKNETWVDLKTLKMYKGYSGCSSTHPYFASTAIKSLPIGHHVLRWERATDRAFTKYETMYKEFQVIIQPEAI